MTDSTRPPPPVTSVSEAHARILAALSDLRFGAVEIQVHDSRIVRITRVEKVRVDDSGDPAPRGRSTRVER